MKSDLKRANALYRGGKYAKAIRLLEPQVFRYRESFPFYYILGMSCLHMGDTGGAKTYLDRALSLKPHDSRALAGLAVVHLKRYEITEALQCYLDITDSDEGNRIARRGLKLLRKNADRDRLAPIIDSGRVDRLLPKDRSRSALMFTVFFVVAILAAGGGYAAFRIANRPEPRESEVAALSLEEVESLTAASGEVRYALSEQEIRATFERAKRAFADYHDNIAIREINTLLNSNASPLVQEQARTILQFIEPPDFTTIRDSFAYETVAADPPRYEGAYVVWRGRISNLEIRSDRIEFDLLVGYDTERVLEGVVRVVLRFAVDLSNGRPVEVLGAIRTSGEGFFIEGTSIHKLAVE